MALEYKMICFPISRASSFGLRVWNRVEVVITARNLGGGHDSFACVLTPS